ncbi:hypothetical protein [Leptotrichia sp. OH3620_COT-345]|uniref:hypothetical protein n=1 Tax=Leptotrichia sp. OH3620_COT-345 TaxID=2491048 RepID=UPI0013151250|nr:hypothetical protein [Leptotrichia sp. OH3620_COT-345]
MKKIVMMIILGIMLNSCGTLGLARYGIEETISSMETQKLNNQAKSKTGSAAILNEKYRKEVEEAIKDVSKRAINKQIQFGEITLIISENTTLNSKQGNIVDLKTGFGLPIYFIKESYCSNLTFTKKINGNHYKINYYGNLINELAQKIIKANGFTKTCN